MLVALLIGAAVVAVVCLALVARRFGPTQRLRALARIEPVDTALLAAAPEPRALLPAAASAAPAEDASAPSQTTTHATRYPIVLVHGFLGFDTLSVAGKRLSYFRDVPERLRAAGAEVHVVRVSAVAGVAVRARELADAIRALEAPRVNVVAHSMGGLDARFAVATYGLADRVASVVTVGTPHRGTPLADSGVQWLERSALLARRTGAGRRRVVATPFVFSLGLRPRSSRTVACVPSLRLGTWHPLFEAVRDLGTARMEAFNRFVPNVDGVFYGSCVASARGGARGVSAALVPSYLYLARHGGDSDGLVPAASQRWGEVLAEIDVDHWGQTGWSSRFDARAFYEALIAELAARGL